MDANGIERLRIAIIKQADEAGPDGWMEIPVDKLVSDKGVLRVPRGAFEQWAVRPSGAEHLASQWHAVSPQGLKQGSDDPYHTDWMLGAGLNPKDMRHDSPRPKLAAALNDAAYAARAEVERRLLDFDCSVLLPGPDVIGRAWHPASADDMAFPYSDEPPVAVLRDARPDWLPIVIEVLGRGGAVIVERGGEMAHLVTEARGGGYGPIVRMSDARRLYPDNLLVKVAPSVGRIEIQDDWRMPPRSSVPSADEFKEVPQPEATVHSHEDQNPFNLVRMDGGNPADACPYMWTDRGAKVEGVNYTAYGVVFSSDYDGNDCHLAIRVYGRGESYGFVANYYAGSGKWPYTEVRRAAEQALEQYDRRPSIQEVIARERDLKQARVDAFKNHLRAMSDEELIALVQKRVEQERKFYEDVEDGKWDLQDQSDIRWDYTQFFWYAGDEMAERGLPEIRRSTMSDAETPTP